MAPGATARRRRRGTGRPGTGAGGTGGGRPAPPGQRPPSAAQRPSTLPANNIYDRPTNRDRNAARPATGDARPYRPAAGTNDVYAGRDGNVYRRNEAGGWDQRSGSGWQSSGARPSQTPAGGAAGAGARPSQMPAKGGGRPSYGGAPGGLDRDHAARQRASAPRSYGGGGMRGGGGRGGRR
jgi:hypothetical protein